MSQRIANLEIERRATQHPPMDHEVRRSLNIEYDDLFDADDGIDGSASMRPSQNGSRRYGSGPYMGRSEY